MTRVGFLGLGPTGLARMAAMLEGGELEAAAICDPSLDRIAGALGLAPDATIVPDLDEMLELRLDGVAIAGPAGAQAALARKALAAGTAVFAQAPLGRTAAETRAAVEAAKAADSFLACDLLYRFNDGMQRIREYAAGGEIGTLYAAEIAFHRARPADPNARAGCMTDPGLHLLDLALWMLGFPAVERVESHLFAEGEALGAGELVQEDFALATIGLAGGRAVRIAASFNASLGREAAVDAVFTGTGGAAALRNLGGVAEDLRAEILHGARSQPLSATGEPFADRAAARWATRLASGEGYDPQAEHLITLAEVLDRIYGR